MDALNNRVVAFCVVLWRCLVFKVDFVQYFPIRQFVVIAGFMPLAIFVGESTFGILANEAAEIVA